VDRVEIVGRGRPVETAQQPGPGPERLGGGSGRSGQVVLAPWDRLLPIGAGLATLQPTVRRDGAGNRCHLRRPGGNPTLTVGARTISGDAHPYRSPCPHDHPRGSSTPRPESSTRPAPRDCQHSHQHLGGEPTQYLRHDEPHYGLGNVRHRPTSERQSSSDSEQSPEAGVRHLLTGRSGATAAAGRCHERVRRLRTGWWSAASGRSLRRGSSRCCGRCAAPRRSPRGRGGWEAVAGPASPPC
jgi:hypothetical protein